MIEQASLVIGEGNWAVKSDSLLGYKINGGKYYPREMSVVRATTGTRINEDGLVELVPYNLLQYSEQFDNAYWVKSGLTLDANVPSPIGTLTAYKLKEATNTGVHEFYKTSLGSGATHSISIYAKAAERNWMAIRVENTNVFFDLANGVLGTVDSGNTGTIENVGNGWYRCTLTRTTSAAFSVVFRIADANNSMSYTGDGTSGIYAWGAQLVEGTSALDYLPTTDRLDVARIDYSSGSGALLVEPQRTNLALYSSSFDNAYWTKNSSSIIANDATAPDGTMSADKVTLLASAGRVSRAVTLTDNANYTASIFVKNIDATNATVRVRCSNNAGNTAVANFTLTGSGSVSDLSNATATISVFSNDWYRCTLTFNAESGASTPDLRIISNATGGFTTGESVFIWGAQLEEGSYPTSLIPTQAATVTRNADVISKTGIADLIGQTEGTFFVQIGTKFTEAVNLFELGQGSSQHRFFLFTDASNKLRLLVVDNFNIQVNYTSTQNIASGDKIAVGYKLNDYAVYLNGTQITTDNSATVPPMNQLALGADRTAIATTAASLSQFYMVKTRLTNAELATLTTI